MKSYKNKEKGIRIEYDDIYLFGGVRTQLGELGGTVG